MKSKALTSFKRALYLGWRNFSREMGLSFVSLFVLVITISMITSLFLLRGVSEEVIAGIEQKADITVDFDMMVSEEKILEIRDDIFERFEISNIQYNSREEVKMRFMERWGDNPIVMEALDEVGNPFPASLQIRATDPQTYREISDFVKDSYPEFIYAIDFYERAAIIDGIFSVTESTRRAGIAISVVLIILAVVLVLNTVKLAIYGMREEIRVMGLVGSSNLFIQSSFITQGTVLGLFSALISFVFYLLLLFFLPQNYLGVDLYHYLLGSVPMVLIIQFSVGVLLGVLSSLVAINRYLK